MSDLRTKPPENANHLKEILCAGLVAGTMDLTAACVISAFRGTPPVRIMQSVATGLLGMSSYQGGFKTAALGVVLHFLIALGATTVFYVASLKLRFLVQWAVISGIAYGSAVYAVMQLVVLPLSRFPHKITFRPFAGLLVHILCIGLPIALIVRRFRSRH